MAQPRHLGRDPGLTPLLALAGWRLTPEGREAIVAAIVAVAPLVGAAVTLYGRWRAKTPLGAKASIGASA